MTGSELFRQGPRPMAMSLAGVTNWLCTTLIAVSFSLIQVRVGCPQVRVDTFCDDRCVGRVRMVDDWNALLRPMKPVNAML